MTSSRFGMYVKMTAGPGQRGDLAALLAESAVDFAGDPGCELFVVNVVDAEPHAVWITEVWASPADHERLMALPAVVARTDAIMATLCQPVEVIPVVPVGGKGLAV